ncbi:MAG: lytic transglycosylase domain-containing protein [Pseudomonadota bacterium]
MARLRLAAAAVFLAWTGPATADPLDRWAAYVTEASARFALPEEWIRRVMSAESGGRPDVAGRPVISRAGAIGLMQLMPGTWREMRSLLALGQDPNAPRDNILAGAAYLRAMYDRFGYPGLYAAYNAGPGRYADRLATGRRLPTETVAYVATVAGTPIPARTSARQPIATQTTPLSRPVPTLFVVGQAARPRGNTPRKAKGGLFVQLAGTAER